MISLPLIILTNILLYLFVVRRVTLHTNSLQLVWASTYEIGCGYITVTDKAGYSQYYVCHYGPGVKVGQPVYRIGEPATECVEGTVQSMDIIGLCESTGSGNGTFSEPALNSPSDC